MTRQDLLAKLTGPRPTYIRRRALPDQVAAVNAIGDVGFDFPREKERLYPQLTLAAHVLGFINADGHGVTGVEGAFDQRSEEHTSELKSLMRNSYAVFSLKQNTRQ